MNKYPSILIVDNDDDICLLLEEIYKCHGIPNFTSKSVAEAKVAISQHKPTHIILDSRLPDDNGHRFPKYLAQNFPEIKVILIAGDFEEIEGKDFLTGMFEIIKKPFTADCITKIVEKV